MAILLGSLMCFVKFLVAPACLIVEIHNLIASIDRLSTFEIGKASKVYLCLNFSLSITFCKPYADFDISLWLFVYSR